MVVHRSFFGWCLCLMLTAVDLQETEKHINKGMPASAYIKGTPIKNPSNKCCWGQNLST